MFKSKYLRTKNLYKKINGGASSEQLKCLIIGGSLENDDYMRKEMKNFFDEVYIAGGHIEEEDNFNIFGNWDYDDFWQKLQERGPYDFIYFDFGSLRWISNDDYLMRESDKFRSSYSLDTFSDDERRMIEKSKPGFYELLLKYIDSLVKYGTKILIPNDINWGQIFAILMYSHTHDEIFIDRLRKYSGNNKKYPGFRGRINLTYYLLSIIPGEETKEVYKDKLTELSISEVDALIDLRNQRRGFILRRDKESFIKALNHEMILEQLTKKFTTIPVEDKTGWWKISEILDSVQYEPKTDLYEEDDFSKSL